MMKIFAAVSKNGQGNLRKLIALTLPMMVIFSGHAQKIARLEVGLPETLGLDVPVQINLDPLTHLPDSALTLVEIKGQKSFPVAFQIDADRRLIWLVNDKVKKRVYELRQGKSASSNSPVVGVVKENGSLTIKTGNRNLIRYHYGTVYPPAGIDSAFKRSAFIHPLWSPHGQVLTRIQPPDHYHHYGLWNPWTHVLYDGDTVDFWNLKGREGTVRFANFISVTTGQVFGEYSALHEHVAFQNNGGEKVVINEVQTVRVYVPGDNPDYYIADITIRLNCQNGPVRLLEYRYGGLGWRATEQWTKENSGVLSSEGKTRKEADGSKARWCIVEGAIDHENAGVVMMSYPLNYNHPEPLRIWPENSNGRGDLFANFSPTKDMDWPLEPGKNYTLRYRFIVFNGSFLKEKAERAWQYFAAPPVVSVTKLAH